KSRLVEKIAELVRDKRIEGISDIIDESSGDDIKITVEIKKDANANVVLNQLYKFSSLQETFGVIMLALVNGKPEVLDLKKILEEYLKHQENVVTKRTQFDLEKAAKRAHILEGLKVALGSIDEVIKIIRTSYDNAKERLMETFSLSDVQAQAILEMQLRRLQGLENEKIDNEHRELMEKIKYFNSILEDKKLLYGVIKEEILIVKAKYADERRTEIVNNPGEIDVEDLIEEETVVFTLSNLNYIKRTPLYTYKSQNRGGRGIIGMQTREEDFVKDLFVSSTHDTMLFFTNHGKVYRTKGYQIPEAGRQARGMAIINLLEVAQGETISAVIPVRQFEENKYLVMITKHGVVKKTDMMSYANIRKGGLNAVNLRDNDELIAVLVTKDEDELFVSTHNGMGIRFSSEDTRAMGRVATGVRGIRLREGDYVISAGIIEDSMKVLNVTENGYGKRTNGREFNIQQRGGIGVKVHQITEKTGKLVSSVMVNDNEQVMLITSEGVIIRLRGADISTFSRSSQGVKLMNLDEGVQVVGVAKIHEDSIEETEAEVLVTNDDMVMEKLKETGLEE
ncbi:MAG: DNA gyrase C-terminal beta-propeller domain-containing protein, partial [Anaerotignaceae bacterium]